MTEPELEKRVDEFCENGNLDFNKSTLNQIFDKIRDNGCKISARYDSDISKHEYDYENKISRIRISLSKKYDKSIHIIWTILHEFGHHLEGPISKKDEKNIEIRKSNELNAWKHAEKEIKNYPELFKLSSDFKDYCNSCLITYGTSL